MAGVPQIAAAAAGAGDGGRAERRGDGDRAGQPAAPARGDPRSLEPADEPPAIAARYLSARQSGIDRRNPASQIHRDPVRPAHRLCRAAPAAGAGDGASGQAHGVVADRGARLAGAAGRHGRGLEPARRISAQLRRRSLAKSHRVCVELRRRAGTGPGRRKSNCTRKRRSRRCIFESVRRSQSPTR